MTPTRPDLKDVLTTLAEYVSDIQTPVANFERVQTTDPFKVLVATILSSRTKDEVTAAAAQRLFSRAQNPQELARLDVEEIESLIYPVGFYRNKAKFLSQLPRALEGFGGQVPGTLEGLLSLPGVGRKTANLVLARAFKQPAICVDTHVHRLANMWGYVDTKTPEETEKALEKLLPKELWPRINSILVSFGQSVCKPVGPRCTICPLKGWCPKSPGHKK